MYYVHECNTEDLIQAYLPSVTAARYTAFRISKRIKLKTKRMVPWWNEELKISWKKSHRLRPPDGINEL